MSLPRFLARRLLFAVFSAYLVVSITFGFVALTADPQIALVAHGAAQGPPGVIYNQSEAAAHVNEAVSAYKEANNLDSPVEERYVEWLVNVATLDWGESLDQQRPVTALLGEAVPRTALYVVPALLFSLVGGIGLGVFAALRQNTLPDYLVTGLGYLGFSVPVFVLAERALARMDLFYPVVNYRAQVPPTVRTVVLPALVLGVVLLGGQLRHTRAESLDHLGEPFVKLLRAKGASRWVVVRHVLRNSSVSLLSLFVAEMIAVLVVNIYVVEAAFGIEGLGHLSLTAIRGRDLPVIIGTAMCLVFVGIVGNLLQDVAHVYLDPRIVDDAD